MKARRAINDFLNDIRSAAIKAQQFVGGMDFDTFASDEKTAFAVVRALAVEGPTKNQFVPKIAGVHGSSTLIASRNPQGAEENWTAVLAFLSGLIPTQSR